MTDRLFSTFGGGEYTPDRRNFRRAYPDQTRGVQCRNCDAERHELRLVRKLDEKAKGRFGWPWHARYKYRGWCPDVGDVVLFVDEQGQAVPVMDSRDSGGFDYTHHKYDPREDSDT